MTEPGTETASSQSQSSLFNHKTISERLDGETGLWHENSSISEEASSTSPAGIPSPAGGMYSLCGPCCHFLAAWLSRVATEHEEFCASATVLC